MSVRVAMAVSKEDRVKRPDAVAASSVDADRIL